jgi:hypothetical protein
MRRPDQHAVRDRQHAAAGLLTEVAERVHLVTMEPHQPMALHEDDPALAVGRESGDRIAGQPSAATRLDQPVRRPDDPTHDL